MFDTILIANRGEIACRIIETARKLGVRSVAVNSQADAGARHVQMADAACCIGPAAASDSYLNGARILEAAARSGAQAIHPGYGFLSENPDFVTACEDAGFVFIGPSAEAIRAMGLKGAAKDLMIKAGVPVVPGYQGADQSAGQLAERAAEIGYPVLIKAVAGGGGKGMRLVTAASEFGNALQAARNEAQAAFGNGDVLIEKYISNPRHIEMQIFGDGQEAVHLFERDCSLQRRHQKVIEEAPAPGMTAEMRAAMGRAAVRAAKAIGYKGAGTVEFIVDGQNGLHPDKFWFMEMNTRLQVEHPVTEAVTGIDLVAWQLRVASGEPLPLAQADITHSGHAFEARLYAEDVPAGFLPATGKIAHLNFAHDARIDTGVRAGDEISPHYDPMIAKITCHGATRAIALSRLRRALAQTELAGTTTNLNFLHALASHEGFARGQLDTGLIERDLPALIDQKPVNATQVAMAAVVSSGPPDFGSTTGFSLWQPLAPLIRLQHGDVSYEATLRFAGPARALVQVDGAELVVNWADGQVQCDGLRHSYWVSDRQVHLFGAQDIAFDIVNPLERQAEEAGTSDQIIAPMPGVVRALEVREGDTVARGARLAVLEAMKMEHGLVAPRDLQVARVLVAQGQQLTQGQIMIQFEPEVR